MRRRFAVVAVACALGTLALLLSAGASAAQLPFHLPSFAPKQMRTMVSERIDPQTSRRSFHPAFHLKTRDGYTLEVIGDGNHVLLEVTRPHVEAVTVYVARGTVTRNRIVATFGTLGRVAMRFRPGARAVGHDCRHGHRVQTRSGVFAGRMLFAGENEYLSVDARRAKGRVSRVAGRCHDRVRILPLDARRGEGHNQGPEPRFLFAGWRHQINGAALLALDLFGKTLYLSLTESSEERMAVFHVAFAIGPAKGFRLDDALTQASLSPPAPFHGTGTYTAAPDGTTTWEGTLSVNFPGAPRYVLTGPPFEAELAAGFEH